MLQSTRDALFVVGDHGLAGGRRVQLGDHLVHEVLVHLSVPFGMPGEQVTLLLLMEYC